MVNRNRRRKSTASKNSTESDIITFLDKYFIDFEDNLRGNNFDKINTLLVQNIIDKFDRIFQLWDENMIFQASIGREKLENVYKSMYNVFNPDFDRIYEPVAANDFTLECNHCGEAFPLRNGDCQYSFNVHALSQNHIEFIRNLNTQHDDNSTSSQNDALLNDVLLTVDRIVVKHESFIEKSITSKLARLNIKSDEAEIVDKPGPVIKRKSENIESFESRINKGTADRQIPSKFVVEVEKSANNPQISSPKSNSISLCDANKCITFYNNALHCKICGVKLAHIRNIMSHVKGKMHKNRIKVCGFYVSRIAQLIRCPIPNCSDSLTKFELLMEHFQSAHKIV